MLTCKKKVDEKEIAVISLLDSSVEVEQLTHTHSKVMVSKILLTSGKDVGNAKALI